MISVKGFWMENRMMSSMPRFPDRAVKSYPPHGNPIYV